MTDLGYKLIFDKAQEISKKLNYSELFSVFHEYPELFHFIVAPSYQYDGDDRALQNAKAINSEIYQLLLDKGPSKLGRGSELIDGVEARHILLMTYLITKLGKTWGNVVEVGGGYGNCFRLVYDIVSFNKWSIIDLDYISDLQKWFLTESQLDLTRLDFIYSDHIPSMVPDLVIGAHSLSEISLQDFINYYERIVKKATWFFYVSQNSNPSEDLLTKKLNIIVQDFYLFDGMHYEDGASIMSLWKRR